ncbi:MAG: hypothetical protein ACSHYA_18495 [Opitutaceae bacterium]
MKTMKTHSLLPTRILTATIMVYTNLCPIANGEEKSFFEQLKPELGDLKLKYLDADNGSDPTGGIQFEKSATGAISVLEDTFFNQYELEFEATFAIDADANPDPVKAQFSWYGSYDGFNTEDSVDEDGDPVLGLDFGFLSYGLNTAYETDQEFHNQNVSAGVFLSYAKNNSLRQWFLIPNVYVTFEGVKNLRSELREQIGVDDNDEYTRFGWELHWDWHLSDTLGDGFSPWVLNLNYRSYYERDQEEVWEAANLDRYDYWKADLAYAFEEEKYGLSEIFVAVSDGRLPTGQTDQTTLSIGFILNPEKFGL